MNALANDDVGKYLNRHFASAFQRVGTFQVAGAQKQGGNVASYFCTSDGLVLHAVAGPVDAVAFLREAQWTVDIHNMAVLKNLRGQQPVRAFFRKAHYERLQTEHGISARDLRFVNQNMPIRDWRIFFDQNVGRIGANQGKVHLLLAANPLPRIQDVYQKVFDRILNEKIATQPVAVAGR